MTPKDTVLALFRQRAAEGKPRLVALEAASLLGLPAEATAKALADLANDPTSGVRLCFERAFPVYECMPREIWEIGTPVLVSIGGSRHKARVVEDRGPIGVGGRRFYTVELDGTTVRFEVPGMYLVLAPPVERPADPLDAHLCPGCGKHATPDDYSTEEGEAWHWCQGCGWESNGPLRSVREIARLHHWGGYGVNLAAWTRAVLKMVEDQK